MVRPVATLNPNYTSMKLKLIRLALKLLRPVYRVLEHWLSELEWAEIANTPVEPNPYVEGTLDYYLHEEGNRIRAEHRIKAKLLYSNPWLEIVKDIHPWLDQPTDKKP